MSRRRRRALRAALAAAIATAALAGAVAPPAAQAQQYLGCYRDQGDTNSVRGRDLDGFMSYSPTGTDSVACTRQCAARGFAYAGMQYGSFCFCGNAYGRSGPAENCNMACPGKPAEMCGGAWANSVYRVTPAAAAQPATRPGASDTARVAAELVMLLSEKTLPDLLAVQTAQAWPALETALKSRHPSLSAAVLADLRRDYDALLSEAAQDLMQDAPDIYARHLTIAEMREIIAFYRTPAGAKLLRTMPKVMSETQAMIAPRLQRVEERVNLGFLLMLEKRGLYAR